MASIVVGVPTLVFWFYQGAIRIAQRYRSRTLRPGIYRGFWIDPVKVEVNCEVLRLRRWLGGFHARPVYIHKERHDYVLRAEPVRKSEDIYSGRWDSKRSSLYRGPALFRFNDQQLDLTGRWLGPKTDHTINGGEWHLFRYAAADKNEYLDPPLRLRFEKAIARVGAKPSIVADIIAKHKTHGNQPVTIEGITLDVEEGAFVPTLGKVSIALVQHAATIVRPGERVLDLGTGTGFYAIYLANALGVKVVGVDITPELINLARANAAHNGVADLTDFATCEEKDLFSDLPEKEKFDVIIANLPFSRRELTWKSRSSPLYESFAGSRRLVEQLILGSQFHARPGARLLFCYGRSGYWEYLHDVIQVSAWNSRRVEAARSKDDTFYIFHLELSQFVQAAYARLAKAASNSA